MMRTQAVKLARATPSVRRSLTVSAFRAAEGDTGSVRSGGTRSGYDTAVARMKRVLMLLQ